MSLELIEPHPRRVLEAFREGDFDGIEIIGLAPPEREVLEGVARIGPRAPPGPFSDDEPMEQDAAVSYHCLKPDRFSPGIGLPTFDRGFAALGDLRARRKKKATPAGVALSNRNQLLDE